MFHLDKQNLGYGKSNVLQNISIEIKQGEHVSILGSSGAGKSTLLTSLFTQHADDIALIPQDTALVKTLSVFHNVYMGRLHEHSTFYNLRNLIFPVRKEIEKMQPLLEYIGLNNKLRTPVGKLSGGQAQRTAVARAIHQGKDILFGDEPVSAVDPSQARNVLSLIHAKHQTVILAMHDTELALQFSDRIIGLQSGHLVLDQPASEITSQDLKDLYANESTNQTSLIDNNLISEQENQKKT